MPDRIVRHGILTSDAVNRLGWPAEVFYRRLMSALDDYGRFDGRLAVLRATLYPLQLNKVGEPDIGRWIGECQEAGLVRVYTVEDKPFIELLKFDQRVRADKSKWPDPPPLVSTPPQSADSRQQMPPLSYSLSKSETKASTARKRATALPDGFAVSNRVADWAKAKGHGRLAERLEAFVSYAKRKGATYCDWDEALMTSIREDWAKLGKPAAAPQKVTAPDCNVPGCKREGMPGLGGKCEQHYIHSRPPRVAAA